MKKKLNMKSLLMTLSILQVLSVSLIMGLSLLILSRNALVTTTKHSLLSTVGGIGNAFDYTISEKETQAIAFAEAPIVKEYLKNLDDEELAKKAQEYTVNYLGKMTGWEAIYLATWDSLVLTHPNEGVIGITIREGDSLKSLQDAMLSSDGVYNVGILTSPASGNRVMSLYVPVYDEGQTIGFVGAAIYVCDITSELSDVSELQLDTANVSFIDNKGEIISHSDETLTGTITENEEVLNLVERMQAGEKVEAGVLEYKEANVKKYASYFIGKNNSYIAILSVDVNDALSISKKIQIISLTIFVISMILFSIIAIINAQLISKPLRTVSKSLSELGTGNLGTLCNAKSAIAETTEIIDSFNILKNNLHSSIGNVKESASVLFDTIVIVDEKATSNADSVSQINDAINEVASSSQTVAQNAQIMAEKVVELEISVEGLNNNVSGLYDASKFIQDANNEATECMKSVYDGSINSVKAMQDIAEKIDETSKAIITIADSIGAIESIATQTNLLSLNASIEAARAGEAGRGFAVVADEIRILADSSAQSAKDIKDVIENITKLASDMVRISNVVSSVIEEEQADIEKTQAKFNALSQSVNESISEINEIKGMSVSLEEIKIEIANAITELGAISEELGASAEQVAASCHTVKEACTDTQTSTEEMRAINDNMSCAISYFKL